MTFVGVDLADGVDHTVEMLIVDGELMTLREAGQRLDLDTLSNLGLCDCGVWLADHPPLPKPKPLGGWESINEGRQPWRNTLTGKVYTEAQRARHRLARENRPPPSSQMKLRG